MRLTLPALGRFPDRLADGVERYELGVAAQEHVERVAGVRERP